MQQKNLKTFLTHKQNRIMENFLKKIEKWIDTKIFYFLYNGNKRYRYHQYLRQKYGNDL